ncbi:hypothetical protein CRENPOLYSF2_1050011 [Crenothrix polyspora]|uniref:Uncharacterized protein n=1 Tax=Crenothrix polyspora TaxID=360316 RepID=A0A1R4H057_9GAMM|nr:hypothetical protein CRENPOLYSF2_1050011 [Crenothrix polyspora]
MQIEFVFDSLVQGVTNFDKRAGYYQSDVGIGKTCHMVVSQYLCFAHVGPVFDYAGVVVICRTVGRLHTFLNGAIDQYLWLDTSGLANSFWYFVRSLWP